MRDHAPRQAGAADADQLRSALIDDQSSVRRRCRRWEGERLAEDAHRAAVRIRDFQRPDAVGGDRADVRE